jgi:2,3-dihydroxybenzoate-AMP ligase
MLEGCKPLPEEAFRRYREAGALQDETLGEIIDRSAERFPERIALVAGERRVTYRELYELTEHLADHLVALGLRPQDRVVLQLPNVLEFILLYFSLAKIGAVAVGGLAAHRAREISYFVSHSQAYALAVPRRFRNFDYLPLANEQKQQHPHLRLVLVADPKDDDLPPGFVSIPRLLEKPVARRPKFRADPFDVGYLLLSGGTTALPKLIPRTHSNYAYNSRLMSAAAKGSEETVVLLALPMAHNAALLWMQGALMRGGTVVISYEPDAVEHLKVIERERVTVIPGVPTLIVGLLDAQLKERRDLSSLKVLVVGGAKFARALVEQALKIFGCQVQQVFGTGEGLCTATSLDDPLEKILETVGKPLSPFDEVRVVDTEDRDVRPGEMGELITRGPYTLRAYYKAPEANAKSFTPDGFYRTGDLVRIDDDGYMIVMGRSKDVVNRAGEKISAEEVEGLLADHPKIKSAILVPMPHPVTVEKGCLFVIPREGSTLTLRDVTEHLDKKQVAKFKYPERLEIIDTLPMTMAGKIARHELREAIARKLAQEKGEAPSPG